MAQEAPSTTPDLQEKDAYLLDTAPEKTPLLKVLKALFLSDMPLAPNVSFSLKAVLMGSEAHFRSSHIDEIINELESDSRLATVTIADFLRGYTSSDPDDASAHIRKHIALWYKNMTEDEIARLAAWLQGKIEGIEASVRSKNLERRFGIDTLTGIDDRRGLMRWFANKDCTGFESMVFIFFDIDHFKTINDVFGHDRGDEVLQALGNQLKQAVRPVDEVTRYGGEEFWMIIPLTDLRKVAAIVNEKYTTVNRRFGTQASTVLISPDDSTIPNSEPTLSAGAMMVSGEALRFFSWLGQQLIEQVRPTSESLSTIKKILGWEAAQRTVFVEARPQVFEKIRESEKEAHVDQLSDIMTKLEQSTMGQEAFELYQQLLEIVFVKIFNTATLESDEALYRAKDGGRNQLVMGASVLSVVEQHPQISLGE